MKELEGIKAKRIMFADVNFFDDRDRVVEICNLIIKRGVKKKPHVQVRLYIANHPEMIEKMEQAGVVSIMIGIDSPHDRILKQMNKQQTQQDIRDAFKVLRRFNKMFLKGFYIVGNIGETEEEIK